MLYRNIEFLFPELWMTSVVVPSRTERIIHYEYELFVKDLPTIYKQGSIRTQELGRDD